MSQCPECYGSGRYEYDVPCHECHGRQYVWEEGYKRCTSCNGYENETCYSCNGSRQTWQQYEVSCQRCYNGNVKENQACRRCGGGGTVGDGY